MTAKSDLLLHLYKVALYKYRKLYARYDRNIHTGRFQKFTRNKRNSIVRRLEKLRRRIQQLSLQLKLGFAAGALSLVLSVNDVQAQQTIGPFVNQPRSENPVRAPLLGFNMYPAAGDVDKDGDTDIVVGLYDGRLRYFKNVGSSTKPAFDEMSGIDNPFDDIDLVNNNASPAFADIDKDNDLDLFLADNQGTIHYYRNDNGAFSLQTGPWNSTNKTGSPFNGISTGNVAKIAMLDIDIDGDVDMLIGSKYGGQHLTMFENDGTGNFAKNTKFDGVTTSSPRQPAMADIDKDGDLDLFLGADWNYSSNVACYRNDAGVFVIESGEWNGTTGNPLGNFFFDGYAAPLFVDLDSDSDLDAIVGRNYVYGSNEYENSLAFIENTGNFNLVLKQELENPFDGILAGALHENYRGAAPAFLDVDNDNDLDLVLGTKYENTLRYYKFDNAKNIFVQAASSFDAFSFGNEVVPRTDDYNNDGFVDVFVNNQYFQNNHDGTFSRPGNPFNTGGLATPSVALLDVDGDNDKDVFVGTEAFTASSPGFGFYRNNNGSFVYSTAPFPFNQPNELENRQAKPTACDFNNDGLLDLVIGSDNGNLRAYVNSGNDSFAEFQDMTYPFNDVVTDNAAAPFLIDYDKDGDLDLFVGGFQGKISFAKNENPFPTINTQTVTQPIPDQPVIIFPNLILADLDDDPIARAVVSINSFSPTNEQLTISGVLPNGITSNYNPSTGILTISGSGTVAEYQAVLRMITYENKVGAFSGGRSISKSISMRVFDWDGTTPTATIASLSYANELPVVTPSANAIPFTSGAVTIDGAIEVADNDDGNLIGAQIRITNYQSGEDQLTAPATLPSGITHTFNTGTGVLTLTGIATKTDYRNAIRLVRYQNTSSTPIRTTRDITFTVNDGESNSAIVTVSIVFTHNEIPVVTVPGNPPLYGSGELLIADQLAISDLDDATMQSAVITITGGFNAAQDELLFSNQNGISSTYVPGVLQLSGGASKENYQAALRSIRYRNNSSEPSETDRVISIVVNDGADNSDPVYVNITINRPPVIIPDQRPAGAGQNIKIPISEIVIDPDNNFDPTNINSITIPSTTEQGAATSIVNGAIVIAYSDIPTFIGIDALTITLCDALNRCATDHITIAVGADLIVYNAVSPNGDTSNPYLHLEYIKSNNKVVILNRWGDNVFEVNDYDNDDPAKRFEGFNKNGDELPSGTYFYKIYYSGGLYKAGYLSLKR